MKVAARCGLVLSLLWSFMAFANEPAPFQIARYDEDYAPGDLKGRFDSPPEPYKYLPLSEDGATYVSFGGEYRERYDVFDAAAFGIGRQSDSYDLQRVLLHADLHFNRRVRIFAQLGRHDVFGKSTPILPPDKSPTNVQNLFVDLVPDEGEHWRLRVGRQELFFNPTQRFVGLREGPNLRQSFDGTRLTWQRGDWTVNAFGVRPVIVRPDTFKNHGDPDTRFSGLYVSRSLDAPGNVLEAYWFAWDHWGSHYGATVGDERRRMAGLRFAAKRDGWDTDNELAWQYGTFAGRNIRAWAVGSDVGYTFPVRFKPRAGFRVDGASGGSATDPNTLRTFDPLYPKGLYFDESMLTTYANMWSVRPSIAITPHPSVTLQISEAWRWRQNEQDALYLIPFVPIAGTASAPGRYVGRWTVFDAMWHANRWFNFQFEYVHVAAGTAVREARGDDVDFGMLIAQFRF